MNSVFPPDLLKLAKEIGVDIQAEEDKLIVLCGLFDAELSWGGHCKPLHESFYSKASGKTIIRDDGESKGKHIRLAYKAEYTAKNKGKYSTDRDFSLCCDHRPYHYSSISIDLCELIDEMAARLGELHITSEAIRIEAISFPRENWRLEDDLIRASAAQLRAKGFRFTQ